MTTNQTTGRTVISPTVGRVVWYRPAPTDVDMAYTYHQPLAAIIVLVHHDQKVNLAVFDANGVPHGRTNVRLMQDADQVPPKDEAFACWMPYQQGQAAKNDTELETLKARVAAVESAQISLMRPGDEEQAKATGVDANGSPVTDGATS